MDGYSFGIGGAAGFVAGTVCSTYFWRDVIQAYDIVCTAERALNNDASLPKVEVDARLNQSLGEIPSKGPISGFVKYVIKHANEIHLRGYEFSYPADDE